MPYPNEASARLRDPGDFAPDSFRRTKGGTIYGSTKVPSNIGIIWGKLKGKDAPADPPIPQALRFPTSAWTADEAKKWLKDNNVKYVSFEPASGKGEDARIPDMELRYLATPLEMRAAGEGAVEGQILEGHAALFNVLSQDLGGFREKIAPGCFAETISADDIRALVDHDPGRILGRNKAETLRLKEDDHGLAFSVDLPDTQVGRDIKVSVKRKDITGCSFSFRMLKDEWDDSSSILIRTLVKVRLFDISACTYPAYIDTDVAVRSLTGFMREHYASESSNRNALRRARLALAERSIDL